MANRTEYAPRSRSSCIDPEGARPTRSWDSRSLNDRYDGLQARKKDRGRERNPPRQPCAGRTPVALLGIKSVNRYQSNMHSPHPAAVSLPQGSSPLLGTDAALGYQSKASATDQGDQSGVHAMTEHEVAQRLCVSVKTIRDWRLRCTGPSFVKFGRAVRYMSDDLDAYIGRSRVVTNAGGDR